MRSLISDYEAAAARHDARAAAATFGENGVYENLGLRFEGREAVRVGHEGSYQTTPDMQATYHAELVGPDAIVKRAVISGHVKEQFVGVPASGYVEFTCLFVVRFADGAISYMVVCYDLDDVCQQLNISAAEVRMNLTALQAVIAEGNAEART
jgi:predicted ester cyclase